MPVNNIQVKKCEKNDLIVPVLVLIKSNAKKISNSFEIYARNYDNQVGIFVSFYDRQCVCCTSSNYIESVIK